MSMNEEGIDQSLLKKKLLLIASSGKFTQFTPEQLLIIYQELNRFLIYHTNKLESIELFDLYELNFYLAILTNNEKDAKISLDRITDQFGIDINSQRIKILQSIYYESLQDYKKSSELLTENPNELKLSRRLTTLSRIQDIKGGEKNDNEGSVKYISNLIYYLNLQPSDLIAWSELSSEYCKVGDYKKAIFCLKEVVLQDTLAYPIYYKIGLLNYYYFLQLETQLVSKSSTNGQEPNHKKKFDKGKGKVNDLIELLKDSRDNFMYCIEINENYKKSWVGLNQLINKSIEFYDIFNSSNKGSNTTINSQVKEELETNKNLKPLVEKKLRSLQLESLIN